MQKPEEQHDNTRRFPDEEPPRLPPRTGARLDQIRSAKDRERENENEKNEPKPFFRTERVNKQDQGQHEPHACFDEIAIAFEVHDIASRCRAPVPLTSRNSAEELAAARFPP